MSKLHIKKGDIVFVNAGQDGPRMKEGKRVITTGRVLNVDVKNQRAIVEGVNMVTKSTKPNAKNPQGGMVKKEASIHISNLNVVENGVPVRIGRKRNEKGRLERISKKTGNTI